VVIYERPTTDHICRICQVVEAPAPRWTFKVGMREAAREALALLRHEADELKKAEAVILLAGGHDRMGCFTDQVKLTRALVQNLDEVVKGVKLLGEHEESNQKIAELVALCKKLREDTQRLEEEKATLEEMVESRDELLMEIARRWDWTTWVRMEMRKRKKRMLTMEETPPHLLPLHHHLRCPLLPCLRRSTKRFLWRRSLSNKPRSCMRLSPRCHNSVSTMHS
jgi:predicted metal-dependent enzyme (double-stranded beta helix superfamily)